MRTFWEVEGNYVVGRVIGGLIDYAVEEQCFGDSNPVLVDDCRKIAQRLLSDQPVAELDALTATGDERDFEVLAEHVREAIEKNQPEGALDRLHTFMMKFVRNACEEHGLEVVRDKPLHSIFGEYLRTLREGNHLESAMTERILKSSISVLEAFNDVRNNKSLAHGGCTRFCVNESSFKSAARGLQTGWRSGLAQLSSPVSASSTFC
jgi:hypothetical protein